MLEFGSLNKMLKRATQLNIDNVLINVYSNNEIKEFVINLNRIDQLFEKGEDVQGKIVGTYSAATEAINPSKKEGQPYNFDDTGKYLASFSVIVGSDASLKIVNNDVKEGFDGAFELSEIYGEILGWQEESIQKIIERVLPEIRAYVLREILP